MTQEIGVDVLLLGWSKRPLDELSVETLVFSVA